MLDAFIVVLTHLAPKSSLINDFTNVFENEVAIVQGGVRAQTIAFLLSLEYCDIGKGFIVKSSVLAVSPTATLACALDLGKAVDAVRVFAASVI